VLRRGVPKVPLKHRSLMAVLQTGYDAIVRGEIARTAVAATDVAGIADARTARGTVSELREEPRTIQVSIWF